MRNRTFALSGVFQAAELAQSVATGGILPENAVNASACSLLQYTHDQVESVYGGAANLKVGLEGLKGCLTDVVPRREFVDVINYTRKMIELADLLRDDKQLSGSVGTEIEELRESHGVLQQANPDLFRELADIYVEYFSSLPEKKRIRVMGKREALASTDNVVKIRVFLFAGIRAGLLWRQEGGKMTHLFVGKKHLAQEVSVILDEITS